jgi:hypothetical protein
VSEAPGQLARHDDVALVDVLDRLLGGGVVITGDITLSVADVDLVYLNLRLLLSSVPTALGLPHDEPGAAARFALEGPR